MAENGSVSGHYDGENYASPSPSTGSGNSIRHMGGTSKELFEFRILHKKIFCNVITYYLLGIRYTVYRNSTHQTSIAFEF